jgi:hypothetical protein
LKKYFYLIIFLTFLKKYFPKKSIRIGSAKFLILILIFFAGTKIFEWPTTGPC